jgi:hypothetical protein
LASVVPSIDATILLYRDFRKDERDFAAFRRWLMGAAEGGEDAPQTKSNGDDG